MPIAITKKRELNFDAIICDMDGCLINYPNEPFRSSWDALAQVLPDFEEWIRLRDYYYTKKELYDVWFREQVKRFSGIKVEIAKKGIFPIPYSEGVEDFFSNFNGCVRGILTSGIDLVAEKIASDLGFDFVVSNRLHVRNGVFTGTGELTNLWGKDLELKRVAEERNLDLNKVVYVGDNENDIPCFKIVGYPIAFSPKTLETTNSARYIINDFRQLKEILLK